MRSLSPSPRDTAAVSHHAPMSAPTRPASLEAAVGPRLRRVGWTSAISGALVTFLAVGVFIPALGLGHEQVRLALINAPLLVGYVLVSGTVIASLMGRRVSRALRWIPEVRDPSEQEHSATLALPVSAVKLDAVAWTGAGVLFAVVDGLVQSWELAAVVAGTIWLGDG